MVNPLFETGERIHTMSRAMAEKNKPKRIPITDAEIEELETVDNMKELDVDCSICLEELNRNDIPE